MSRLLFFIAIAVTGLSSCSVYRSGPTRTPDDVYYSPAREGAAYVETDQRKDGYYRGGDDYSSYDDRWLRMRVRDRYRWSAFDDYDWNYGSLAYGGYYGYNPYWNYSLGFNNYWNAMYRWNSFYNPYFGGIIIVNPKVNQPAYTAVRSFSLDRYTNTNYNNTNRPLSTSKTAGLRYNSNYNNGNTRTTNSLGSSLRRVFSNGNNNGNTGGRRETYYNPGSSNDRPNRTYTPSSSSSNTRTYTPSSSSSSSGSSRGGSSGGGGGVSRPSRGNN